VSTLSEKKAKRKQRKHTALILCRDSKQFWTTQAQFWQWSRDRVIVKTKDHPLTGIFVREDEELFIVLSNTVLNLANPNHLREALASRKLRRLKKA